MSMTQTIADTNQTVYGATLEAFRPLMDAEEELKRVDAELASAEGERLNTLIKRQHALREEYEFNGGMTYRSRTRSALMGLGFTEEELTKRLGDMSGGQRNKAQLAKVLLSGAQLLLLDEPTNHLDMDSIAWLEDFLKAYQGAFIVISHDRYFLDAVTRRTMEIKNTRFFVSEGNYTRHRELMADEQEMLRRRYVNTQKEIRRIEGIVEQQRRWGQEHNFITAASKQKQADKLRATLVAPERNTDSIHFRFHADAVSGNDVVVAKGLAKRFDKSVFCNADMLIKKGERVFLLGPNGCGKTTLLKILMGKLKPDAGSYYLGANVHPGYYEQNAAGLSGEVTAIEEIRNSYPRMSDTEIRCALAAFLFRGDDVFKPLEKLSGGEVARVKLLKLMLSGSNLLLLDEPLSNLDARLRLQTREEIRRIQKATGITTVFVTHDQEEAMSISDLIVVMKDGVVQQIGKPQAVYDSPVNLFVAKFLGTPPINVFDGEVKDGQLYIGEEAVLAVPGVADQSVTAAIRPEGFTLSETGALSCDLSRVEVMGRDISVVSTHSKSQNVTIRSIISAENAVNTASQKVRFDLKPNKVFLFQKESGARIDFG